jgi:hypothetical protein
MTSPIFFALLLADLLAVLSVKGKEKTASDWSVKTE